MIPAFNQDSDKIVISMGGGMAQDVPMDYQGYGQDMSMGQQYEEDSQMDDEFDPNDDGSYYSRSKNKSKSKNRTGRDAISSSKGGLKKSNPKKAS